MRSVWQGRPFAIRKVEQLWRQVRESHEQPLTGTPRPVKLVERDELGVTFIGHSSFLLQVDGRKVLIDPVFSKRLVLLRRQRRPGVLVEDLPPIDVVLLTHAHMDHLDMASLRRIIRSTRRQTGHAPEVVVPLGREPMDEPLKRLKAEATRLGISERIKALEEGETMHLNSVARIR